MHLSRRGLLIGLGSLIAASAHCVGYLRPLKAIEPEEFLFRRVGLGYTITREAISQNFYADCLAESFRSQKEWLAVETLTGWKT